MGDQQHSHRRRIYAALLGVLASLVLTGTASLSSAATSKMSASGAPIIRITSAPADPTTSTKAAVAFSVTGKSVRTTCQLDGKTATNCISAKTYTGLTYGSHTFGVRATNRSGSSSASTTWRVAWPTPTATLASRPSDSTVSTSAALAWTSTNATSIVCRLDDRSPAACASPVAYSGLAVGTHTFTVTVSNASGSTSASATWAVIAVPAPSTTTTSTPDSSAVQPPAPPTSYSIPAGAVVVSNSADLASALASSTSQNIVLADGVYDNSAPFENANGHHLYAQHLGAAVLEAGLVMGSNYGAPGGSVQGVVFDVSDPAKVLGGGIVHVWGAGGAQSKVLDCVFRGNNVIDSGVLAYNPAGLVTQRLEFYGFTDVALRASNNQSVSYGAATPVINSISDIYVDGVSRAVPGASDGTGEAGVWVGHPVTNGVQRIKIRNAGWSGIETVNNSWNTVFSDLDIDMSGPNESAGVGIYLEHFNYHNTFQRFSIRGANTGINAEWADPSWGGVAASHLTTIEDGTIDATGVDNSRTVGVYLDEGTDSTVVTGVTFLDQRWAAIGAYKNVGANSFAGNDYSGLPSGVAQIRTDYH